MLVAFTLYLCTCYQRGNIANEAKGEWTRPPRADLSNLKSLKTMGTDKRQPEAEQDSTFAQKEVLTSDEAARYMGISKSYLYKLTMKQAIPHYKPMGKMCYFNRAELVEWLQQNRVATTTEIDDRANRYLMKGGAL